MVPSIAERLSKRAVIVALACAIPLHLYVDPVSGLAVRAAAALAFGVSLFCAKRWARTPVLVSAAAAIAPVVLAAITGTAALNVFYTVILALCSRHSFRRFRSTSGACNHHGDCRLSRGR